MKSKKLAKVVCALAISSVLAGGFSPVSAQAAKTVNKVDTTYISQVFDAEYYFNEYQDVANVFGMNPDKLLEHYVEYGMKEGRNASATFNAVHYKNNYADLKKAFGGDLAAYCRHYIEYGKQEGRNAFDVLVASEEEIELECTEIATYTTKFNAKIGRATNVKLAASQIDGKVLQPGEQFSFLGSITPRTLENGYVVATVFSGGKKSKGIGGGICQVSSTIYAAVSSTSVSIDERHSHSLPVDYVPKGMDATVSAPSLDFRFTNTYDKPMVLSVEATDAGVLTVTVSLQQ